MSETKKRYRGSEHRDEVDACCGYPEDRVSDEKKTPYERWHEEIWAKAHDEHENPIGEWDDYFLPDSMSPEEVWKAADRRAREEIAERAVRFFASRMGEMLHPTAWDNFLTDVLGIERRGLGDSSSD